MSNRHLISSTCLAILFAFSSVIAHLAWSAEPAISSTNTPPEEANPAPAKAANDPEVYLRAFSQSANTAFPKNQPLRIVFHGNAVPAGYFKTPVVRTVEAYPHQLLALLGEKYPYAIINCIVTAMGGETSEEGAKRFESDVLALKPDVVFIDYALSDRTIGLERSRLAWDNMIQKAKAAGVKVVLLTPTPDQASDMDDPTAPLNQHAAQIRVLSRQHEVALADSLAAFRTTLKSGKKLSTLMSSPDHPNAAGHLLAAKALAKWFP